MTPFHCIISNFKNKNCSVVNKRLFLLKFSQLQAFSQKGELCKMEHKGNSIELSVFKIWFNQSEKAPTQIFDFVLSISL